MHLDPRPLHFLPHPRGDIRTRFLAKVGEALPNGCRPWLAALDWDNYGMFKLPAPGRMRRAHRVAYQIFVGPIPANHEIDHGCHTDDESCEGGKACMHRRCVRPSHLRPVLGKINTLLGRGITAREAQQTHCLRGHPFSGPNADVYITPKGARQCRRCKVITTLERRRQLAAGLVVRHELPGRPKRGSCSETKFLDSLGGPEMLLSNNASKPDGGDPR